MKKLTLNNEIRYRVVDKYTRRKLENIRKELKERKKKKRQTKQ